MEKYELFKEFEKHLLEDEKPSLYFENWANSGVYVNEHPFSLLTDLINIQQSLQHHPEGSVWNHTMLVVDNAAKRKHLSEEPRAFMWAALLHDLGKAPTTRIRKGKITSYDHDRVGEKLSEEFIRVFIDAEEDFIYRVKKLVRWHMQILFVVRELPFADLARMTSEVTIDEMALLALCDRLGRGAMTQDKVKEEQENIRRFTEKCEEYLRNSGRDLELRNRKAFELNRT